MGLFSKPKFGDVKGYLNKNAVVLDVRTLAEYDEGHVEGSMHIVLDTLADHIDDLKNLNRPIITCCRSGARSGTAEDYLKDQGLDVINGGPWGNVAKHI